jgi:hypothetical protein
MHKAIRTDSTKLPRPRKLIRKRGRKRPRGRKARARTTRFSAVVNPHRCDPQEDDLPILPESLPIPTSTITSDATQSWQADSAHLSDGDQEKGSAVTGMGCADLASSTEMFNGFRVSELAPGIQRAIRRQREAGGHASGARQHATGEEHQQEAPEDHQHQHQQPCRGGHLRKDSSGEDDSSEQDSEQGSDLSSDPGSYSDSSSDSRQCCADLQMMSQVPRTPSEMMAQRLMDSECLHEGVISFYGKWFCREHAPRPAEPIPNQDEGWECCSIDPPCEQPGHTLHSGLWFCREHALLHKVEAQAQWEGWHILRDTANESIKRLEHKHILLGILLLLWWWEAP